jgi:hypothetical protein
MERAVSLVTVPLSVATPFETEAWIDCPLRFWSEKRRLCNWVVKMSSLTGGALLLQPAMVRTKASVTLAARTADKALKVFIESLSCVASMHPIVLVQRWIGGPVGFRPTLPAV